MDQFEKQCVLGYLMGAPKLVGYLGITLVMNEFSPRVAGAFFGAIVTLLGLWAVLGLGLLAKRISIGRRKT